MTRPASISALGMLSARARKAARTRKRLAALRRAAAVQAVSHETAALEALRRPAPAGHADPQFRPGRSHPGGGRAG